MAKRSKTVGESTAGSNADTDGGEGTIDSILDGLESVVGELEQGDLPLEEALARFERGVDLARRGAHLLDRVEQRVEVLLAERDETVPLADGGRNDNGDDADDPDA